MPTLNAHRDRLFTRLMATLALLTALSLAGATAANAASMRVFYYEAPPKSWICKTFGICKTGLLYYQSYPKHTVRPEPGKPASSSLKCRIVYY